MGGGGGGDVTLADRTILFLLASNSDLPRIVVFI
jgi:hypothetical protein